MIIVQCCQELGCTYSEFMENPNWFINLFIEKLRIDSKKKKDRSQNLEKKANRAKRKV